MARRRRINIRPQKPKVFIFCEGEVTEVRYLIELERSQNILKFEFVKKGAVPKTLFDEAKNTAKQIAKGDGMDHVWLIFDQDEHPNVDEVLNESATTNIVVGYSNPCFEVWLNWHIQEYGGTDGRKELKRIMSDCCEDYCSTKKSLLRADRLIANVNTACQRAFAKANQLEQSGAKNGRPTSTMYEIIDSFTKYSKTEDKYWLKPK